MVIDWAAVRCYFRTVWRGEMLKVGYRYARIEIFILARRVNAHRCASIVNRAALTWYMRARVSDEKLILRSYKSNVRYEFRVIRFIDKLVLLNLAGKVLYSLLLHTYFSLFIFNFRYLFIIIIIIIIIIYVIPC